MAKVTVGRKSESERQPKKVKIVKFERGSGGEPKRLAALLDEVMGRVCQKF